MRPLRTVRMDKRRLEGCVKSLLFAGARERGRPRPLTLPREIGFAPEMSPRAKRAQLCRAFIKQNIPTGRKKIGMAPTAAYLIALALTLLILVVLWEGLS